MKTSRPADDWDTAAAKRSGGSLHCLLLVSLVFFGPAIYFGFEGDYVLAAVGALAGMTAFSGYRLGALAMLGSVAAFAVAIAYAPRLGYGQEFRFTEWFGTTGLLNRILTIGVIGFAITLVVTLVSVFVARKVCRSRPGFDRLNRWCGFGLGAVEGPIACLFFLGGLLIIAPFGQMETPMQTADNARGQFLWKAIWSTTAHTRSSRLGPVIDAYNPFVRFPELNKLEEIQTGVQVLSDPKRIETLLENPNMQELQQRPEIKTAVRKLIDDPQIQDALHSGKPLDWSMAMTLLNHPAVLELVDQPEFVEAAMQAFHSTDVITSAAPVPPEAKTYWFPID